MIGVDVDEQDRQSKPTEKEGQHSPGPHIPLPQPSRSTTEAAVTTGERAATVRRQHWLDGVASTGIDSYGVVLCGG